MVHSEDQTVSSGPFVGEDLGVNSSRTNKDQTRYVKITSY